VYIILPRLSKQTTQDDLLRLASSVLAHKLKVPFTKSPNLHSCMILTITDEAGDKDYHGKLCIEPDSAAEWFIQKIKGQKLHGKSLLAREFIARHRDAKTQAMSLENERRRQSLKIERLKPTEAPSIVNEGARDFDEEAKD